MRCSSTNVSGPHQARTETQATVHLKEGPSLTWAARVGGKAQGANEWTTVGGRRKAPATKKVLKKTPCEPKTSSAHKTEPNGPRWGTADGSKRRNLAINKALAQDGADVSARLTGLRYTGRGHLSGLTAIYASANDVLEHAGKVTAAADKLDPAVAKIEKTEKWRKLRVHGVSLDRYLGDGGLDLAREEIELMTGESLPYTPRWMRGEGLEERFHSGTVNRSTPIVTVKSKAAADSIITKGLSFGGRRHEAEKSWTRGEGGICMQCC